MDNSGRIGIGIGEKTETILSPTRTSGSQPHLRTAKFIKNRLKCSITKLKTERRFLPFL